MMTGEYKDYEGWEDDIQSLTLPSPFGESPSSNIPEFAGNEESQVVPFATLPRNEETHPMPIVSVPSQHRDFKEYFQRPNGFGSYKSYSHGVYVLLCCERSGKPISHQGKNHVPKTTTKKRKCGFIKCDCSFRLNASCDKFERRNVRVGCGFHNHLIPTTLTGHAYAGRLAEEENLQVLELTNSGCRPREILTSIKNKNRKNYSTMRTIYNARRKLKIYAMQGRSLMQHFFKLAQEHQYTVEYKFNPLTKKYRLPLFHVVSHTSTGATFTVAVAFMSREKEANCIWALKCVERLYRENEIPSVFVTDCEAGLISATKHVFPTSSHLLCAWHIGKNKEAKGKLKEKQDEKRKELKKWYGAWQDVIKSSSIEDYQENLTKFISTWEPTHKDDVRYVIKTWLDPYKEKFVSAWTNNIKHFDNVATSRVESAHAKLKLYLGNSRGNFANCFFRAHCSYENEHVNVHSEFERSKTTQMHDHREEDLFKEILNFVSIKALKIIYNEINGTANSMDGDMTCNCLARKINGLPCACEIRVLKTQGHYRSKKHLSSMQYGMHGKNEQVRMRAQLQPIAFLSTVNIYEPEVSEVQRGRKSKKQLMKDRSNEREPSFYEHYLSHMPSVMQKFIAATQEMPMDENSGYHVLLKQLTKKELKEGIDKNEWLRMPESGFIIAEAFTTVVVYLSELQSITFVPTTLVLYPSIEKNTVAIGHVNNNHLIGLKFKRCSPLPSLPRFSYWKQQENENSTTWSKRY
ncbi:hypothetical protein C5167_003127 [Papaver somniferum]|uniref:MULE transposase domain-containing protein n=1 Tax=Papaver somniferum TaxID=3469 RepID=A0A4Y7L3H3_PAPSO|nr:hypothetical protein C5167_003127 [Papaver somniferum]